MRFWTLLFTWRQICAGLVADFLAIVAILVAHVQIHVDEEVAIKVCKTDTPLEERKKFLEEAGMIGMLLFVVMHFVIRVHAFQQFTRKIPAPSYSGNKRRCPIMSLACC